MVFGNFCFRLGISIFLYVVAVNNYSEKCTLAITFFVNNGAWSLGCNLVFWPFAEPCSPYCRVWNKGKDDIFVKTKALLDMVSSPWKMFLSIWCPWVGYIGVSKAWTDRSTIGGQGFIRKLKQSAVRKLKPQKPGPEMQDKQNDPEISRNYKDNLYATRRLSFFIKRYFLRIVLARVIIFFCFFNK